MTWSSQPALRLTVMIDDTDAWHHRPMCSEIVHRAHAAGLGGASIFHGVEGFGARNVVHTTRLLSMADDLPVAVVIVDSEQRVQDFLLRVADPRPAGRCGPFRQLRSSHSAAAGHRFVRGVDDVLQFSFETLQLAENGARLFAAANIVGSIAAGLGAAFAGLYLGQALFA